MKKWITVPLLFLTLLISCSKQDHQELTRVDVQQVDKEGDYEEAVIIPENEILDSLQTAFAEIEWKPNMKVQMSRTEDVLATLFYTYDKNMPERLYEYRIWFSNKDTAEIISNKEDEGYGTLDAEHTKVIIDVLLK